MNDNAEPLQEEIQTKIVLDETFVMLETQTVPTNIAENVSTTSDWPKHTLSNKKTKSKKIKLREFVETSHTSEKLLETLEETPRGRDAEDQFGAYVTSELPSLDPSR